MVRTSANPKKRRRTSGLPIAVPKDVASIRLLIDTVARTNELPLPSVDSVRVRKALFEREDTWPRGKRVEGLDPIDWARRLVAAELYAQEEDVVGIARGLGVDEPVVRDDLEVISVYQVLAEGVGQAQAALSQTRRRFERLQVAAFAALREAESFQLRRRIRTEIGRREMRLFKMLQKVGFYGRVTAGLRVGEPVADERAMDAVKHLPDEGVPYVDRGHIAAIHQLVNAVVHPNQLSLFGAGSVQALKILREGRGTWSAGRKEEGSGEHAAVWARRLLVGTLLAKGGRPLQVAEALGVDRSVVYHDVRALREQQLLSHDTERTKLLLTKSLLRMEVLQQAAFFELTNEEPGDQEQHRIRVEMQGADHYSKKHPGIFTEAMSFSLLKLDSGI